VLDTDVVIAAFDDRDAHHAIAVRGVRGMLATRVPLLLSLVNYGEALVRPARDEAAMQQAIDAIAALRIELIVPSEVTARDAARFRGRGVSLADGFAMATARAHGAALASFDRRVQRAAEDAGIELHAMIAE